MLLNERRKSSIPPRPNPSFQREKSRRTIKDENIPKMMDMISLSSDDNESLNTIISKRQIQKRQISQQLKIQEMEYQARSNVLDNPLLLFLYNGYSAVRIFESYLITIDTLIGIILTVSSMLFCYYHKHDGSAYASMSWMILSITIVNPLSTTLGMSFFRRERATRFITNFRSFSLTIYLGHALFKWNGDQVDERWLKHSDEILSELVGIGDELCRFLTLPTCTLSQHRVTTIGRKEAATTMEVSYRLFNSLLVRRLVKLSMLAETISAQVSLTEKEALLLRKVERQFGLGIESLRMIKMYRTPLALRAFARIFALLLPPFYGPNLAKIAIKTGSLPFAVCFAILTSLSLTTLCNAVQIMEDPFVAYTTLDGIDCREELSVLNWHQLVNARKLIYPHATTFPKFRVDEDGYNPTAKAVEGTVRCDSFILNESQRDVLNIRESAYAAMPMEDEEDDNIIKFTRSRLQSFEERLRNRANTGSSRNMLFRRRAGTVTSMASQPNFTNQEENAVQQQKATKDAKHRRLKTDTLIFTGIDENYHTSIFGERSRFRNHNDVSTRRVSDIQEEEEQKSPPPAFPEFISEMRSRFYSSDANSLTRIRLESFDQNAFSDGGDVETPPDLSTSDSNTIGSNDLNSVGIDGPSRKNTV